jgi:hypothetical protein
MGRSEVDKNFSVGCSFEKKTIGAIFVLNLAGVYDFVESSSFGIVTVRIG